MSFDPPQSWGQQSQPSATPDTTPPTPPATSPISTVIPDSIRNPGSFPEADSPPSFLKIFLISICLILLGILLGILAAKFFQPVAPVVTPPPTTNLSTPTTPPPSIELSSTPMATPSSLLDAQWKSYSTKQYKLFYPSTWMSKYSTDKLTLTKSKSIVTILSKAEIKGGGCENKSVYSINKTDFVWDIQEASSSSLYHVCETTSDSSPVTRIGEITLSGSNIDQMTLDEFKYILEKIVITKPDSSLCGGFAGLLCPSGYSCVMNGSYPDASGTCVVN